MRIGRLGRLGREAWARALGDAFSDSRLASSDLHKNSTVLQFVNGRKN